MGAVKGRLPLPSIAKTAWSFLILKPNDGDPATARCVWPQLLPAVDTVQEGIGGGNMGHQGKKLAGQKGEARTED